MWQLDMGTRAGLVWYMLQRCRAVFNFVSLDRLSLVLVKFIVMPWVHVVCFHMSQLESINGNCFLSLSNMHLECLGAWPNYLKWTYIRSLEGHMACASANKNEFSFLQVVTGQGRYCSMLRGKSEDDGIDLIM